MPISKKIISEIEKLKASDEEKRLLKTILEREDGGIRNYTKPYELEINAYLDNKKDGGD